MQTPVKLITELEEILQGIQTNNPTDRQRLFEAATRATVQLRKLAEAGPPSTSDAYCDEYDLHIGRLRDASRTIDGNHIDLLGAMTAIEKLRGFAGFNLR